VRITRTAAGAAVALAVAVTVGIGGPAAADGDPAPTCAGLGGIANHGQHIVGDYVIGDQQGIGSGREWPYRGEVGQVVGENGGAAIPGGPGPNFHFEHGVPPGASFCTDAQSANAVP